LTVCVAMGIFKGGQYAGE